MAEKDRDRKRAVQGDLDRQIEEKKRRIAQEHERSDAYDKMMEDHHRFLEEKEACRNTVETDKLVHFRGILATEAILKGNSKTSFVQQTLVYTTEYVDSANSIRH